jgi:hypothetical protein
LKAVVSALQSTPIYRLHQTWKHVPKKDRANFEKFEEFMSDNDNRKVLREHMDEAKLPCIPHLGKEVWSREEPRIGRKARKGYMGHGPKELDKGVP